MAFLPIGGHKYTQTHNYHIFCKRPVTLIISIDSFLQGPNVHNDNPSLLMLGVLTGLIINHQTLATY